MQRRNVTQGDPIRGTLRERRVEPNPRREVDEAISYSKADWTVCIDNWSGMAAACRVLVLSMHLAEAMRGDPVLSDSDPTKTTELCALKSLGRIGEVSTIYAAYRQGITDFAKTQTRAALQQWANNATTTGCLENLRLAEQDAKLALAVAHACVQ